MVKALGRVARRQRPSRFTAPRRQKGRQSRATLPRGIGVPCWETTSAVQPTFLGIATVLISSAMVASWHPPTGATLPEGGSVWGVVVQPSPVVGLDSLGSSPCSGSTPPPPPLPPTRQRNNIVLEKRCGNSTNSGDY